LPASSIEEKNKEGEKKNTTQERGM
jgi:hypothetical protein